MQQTVNFQINTAALGTVTDSYLAALWHIGQANPAPIEDLAAGELAEAIGREIISRFLATTPPDLWNHQGSHFFSMKLAKIGAAQRALRDAAAATHFVTVPTTELTDGRIVPEFQYAKYPCSKGADGKLELSLSAAPWLNINFYEAAAACTAAGFELARETQELAVRQNVAAQGINWTGGEVGEGHIYQGLHKGSVSGAQPANYVSGDADERSWHELSNGERVYGLAGNVYTWVFDDAQGDENGVIAKPFAETSPSIATAPYPSMTHGMGWRPRAGADWSGHALVRGGYWDDEGVAGVFCLGRGSPGYRSGIVGFRCTIPE